MAAINKPTARLETSTSTRFFNLKAIEKFDGLKFLTNGEDAICLLNFFLKKEFVTNLTFIGLLPYMNKEKMRKF